MCGICGLYNFGSGEPAEEQVLRRMMVVLRHRGPDDEGTYLSPTCPALGLGHTRLSIIDIAGGHQPLANEDGSVWIILNGEIYNYKELRADLEARGHRFRTETDTETIVHLYEESGTGCLGHLRGMFAFVGAFSWPATAWVRSPWSIGRTVAGSASPVRPRPCSRCRAYPGNWSPRHCTITSPWPTCRRRSPCSGV